jgi:aerobic C4-dicarboxylate transport protein
MKRYYSDHLYLWVLFGILWGIVIGTIFPDAGAAPDAFKASSFQWLGNAFINLVKMLIAPVIFLTVVLGIGGMSDMKKVGRVGGKALLYFEAVSTVALALGLLVMKIVKPGVGFNIDPATLDPKAVESYVKQASEQNTVGFIMHIIPKTFVDAFATGDLLQVLLVSILFGFALSRIGDKGKPVLSFIESSSKVLFGMINIVMKLAPLGAFGAMAFTIGKYGVASIFKLAAAVATFYSTATLFVVVVLGGIAWFIAKVSIFRFLYYIKSELLIVLGTSSSESALAPLMEKLEKLGCSRSVVGLVVPSGYSFNLDGTNIYMTLASLFIAQALNIDLTWKQELSLLAVAMLTSKGASGVTGSGFVTLAATLAVVPSIPVAGMTLILGIDRFMSECRSLTNFIGNGVATIVVSKWEGELDEAKLQRELAGPAFENS